MKKYIAILMALAFTTGAVVAGAAVTQVRAYVFSGTADAALVTEIESGLGLKAFQHANAVSRLDGLLSSAGGNCPIEVITLSCSDTTGVRVWSWEYRTETVQWGPTP